MIGSVSTIKIFVLKGRRDVRSAVVLCLLHTCARAHTQGQKWMNAGEQNVYPSENTMRILSLKNKLQAQPSRL